ncbi:hypothetical protein ID035_31100 [Pseudomonas aeruginosa]|nr:hypothetical protein [Pseudomonas aeruginosa]
MNPSLLDSAVHEEVPVENWDALLSNGGIEPVEIDGMTCLKFHGPRPVYARIASIIAYGGSLRSGGNLDPDSSAPR